MNVKALLQKLVSKLHKKKPYNSPTEYHLLTCETLERRDMLSGNLFASFVGADLFVFGDAEDNAINLELNESQLVLRGVEGTSINGTTEDFVVSESNQLDGNLFMFLREGNDEFSMGPGIELNQSATIYGGAGNDQIGFEADVQRRVRIFGQSGDDQISIRNTSARNLKVSSGIGDDFVSIRNTELQRNLVLTTQSGNDRVAVSETDTRSLMIFSGAGNDDVAVTQSTSQIMQLVATGSGNDFIQYSDTNAELSIMHLGSGSDAIVEDGQNNLTRSLLFGGSGPDQIDASENPSQTRFSFNETSVDQSLQETRITGPSGVVVTSTTVEDAAFENLTTLEPLLLTVDFTAPETTDSNGITVVESPDIVVNGNTNAGALVEVDLNGDGNFDDGSTTADGQGNFSLNVTLTNNDQNLGQNQINVRSSDTLNQEVEESISIHYAEGTVVRFETEFGFLDVELLDEDAPRTVANFLSYLPDFEDSIIHRTPPGLPVVQGGSFTVDQGNFSSILGQDPVSNEFLAANSNIRGTLSMALLSNGNTTDPESGTSGWFFNLWPTTVSLTKTNTPFLDVSSAVAWKSWMKSTRCRLSMYPAEPHPHSKHCLYRTTLRSNWILLENSQSQMDPILLQELELLSLAN